jgi:transcriptional regulator with XRE-family HTH domain
MQNMGDRIRRQRDHLGLSQEEVAAHFDITREAVANWERGANLPRGKRLVKLAEILSCNVQYLLGNQGTAMPTKDDEFVAKLLSLPPSARRTLEAVADAILKEVDHSGDIQARQGNAKKGQ